ncbi:MAG TPA: SDR family NAD(P)-dependent oxidoreductase, partial [Anaerolineae bacterium]
MSRLTHRSSAFEFCKRALDIVIALGALVVLSPLLLLIAAAVKLGSPGPVFFRGERVGRYGKLFRIYKFRSMLAQAPAMGPGITAIGDARITRLGRLLRESKLDELPQFINVLRGEMSLVGPRPEDPRWVEKYTEAQRAVLSVRPGLTSLASLRYRREEELLTGPDWALRYENVILPDKLALDLEYLATRSARTDLVILYQTLIAVAPRITMPNRLWHWMERYLTWGVIDAAIVLFSYGLAFFLRALTAPLVLLPAIIFGLAAVVLYLVLNWLSGIYVRQWRYASGQDSIYIASSTFLASLILGAVDILFFPVRPVPLSVFLIGAVFVILLSTAARFRRRLWRELSLMTTDARKRFSRESFGIRTLIVGAGEEGQLLAWQLRNRMQGQPYDLVAFVDDDPNKQATLVNNTRVAGTRHDIPHLCERLNIQMILIAINPGKIKNPRELLSLCRSTDAQIKVVPGVVQMLSAPASQISWEDAREETLLNRQKFSIDDAACRSLLGGKTVLVTGACGSIGSELARQVAAYMPAYLYLLDNNETGLYDLALELSALARQVQVQVTLADITDAARVDYFFQTLRPQVVFHAAAYKHVPILQAHPYEAVRVNVVGTRNVHRSALEHGTERFIFISSDKAVNPTNMLGLTKRVGEVLVVHNDRGHSMYSAAVRFGNVLGSRGSV